MVVLIFHVCNSILQGNNQIYLLLFVLCFVAVFLFVFLLTLQWQSQCWKHKPLRDTCLLLDSLCFLLSPFLGVMDGGRFCEVKLTAAQRAGDEAWRHHVESSDKEMQTHPCIVHFLHAVIKFWLTLTYDNLLKWFVSLLGFRKQLYLSILHDEMAKNYLLCLSNTGIWNF